VPRALSRGIIRRLREESANGPTTRTRVIMTIQRADESARGLLRLTEGQVHGERLHRRRRWGTKPIRACNFLPFFPSTGRERERERERERMREGGGERIKIARDRFGDKGTTAHAIDDRCERKRISQGRSIRFLLEDPLDPSRSIYRKIYLDVEASSATARRARERREKRRHIW